MIVHERTRTAFTLVELMISAAITILIMTILSYCFQTSMNAMSAMRAQGDAADQLRAVGEVMKRDFKADHFSGGESLTAVNNRGRRLSDYDFRFGAQPTASGFVFINSPASINEGNDGIFDSYRNTGSAVWFTSILPGGNEGNLYTATVGGTTVSSEAAEVAYFLVPTGQFTSGGAIPLFNLARRQRLIAIDSSKQSLLPTTDPQVISTFQVMPGPVTVVNTMNTIATPIGRAPVVGVNSIFTPLVAPRVGDDIIVSNVISFEVKPTWQPIAGLPGPRFAGNSTAASGFPDQWNNPTNLASSDYPFDTLSAFTASSNQFDTLFPTAAHPKLRVNSVQIRLRIYDPKVKTARQMSLIIDL